MAGDALVTIALESFHPLRFDIDRWKCTINGIRDGRKFAKLDLAQVAVGYACKEKTDMKSGEI